MNRSIFTVLAVLASAALTQAGGFEDDFSKPDLEGRQALRGEWKYENNIASCVSDPELYKKFKNHGPILRWPLEFTDGTIEFEFRPNGCQRLVFTLNETGHVFRIVFADEKRTRIFGWAKPSKESDPETLAREGIPHLADLEGRWTKVTVSIKGDGAEVAIGDEFSTKIKHACVARKKSEVTLSFAFGELAVRNVRVATPEK